MTAIVPADPAPYVVRCIDRNVRDLPDRIEVAQALGLLPYVAHSRRADRTSGPRVERGGFDGFDCDHSGHVSAGQPANGGNMETPPEGASTPLRRLTATASTETPGGHHG